MPIEQHPIPQDVAGYKFRLIGDMTLKQFIWLAAGIILGLLIYSLPLPFFFKYPLAALAVGLGAGIAFVPIEGRSMDKWLIAFIKSIYSPTQYVWQKGEAAATQPVQAAPRPVPVAPVKTTPPPSPTPQPAPPTPTRSTAVLSPDFQSGPTPAAPPKPIEVVPPKLAPPAAPPVVPATPPPIRQTQAAPPATSQLPIPFTPTTPNTLVGMTLTPDGKILPGCLIEIKLGGLSQRATKSNQLGQFLFAKPLDNGTYQITTEKEGHQFDTYSLNLTGQIVKPLRLQAKNV